MARSPQFAAIMGRFLALSLVMILLIPAAIADRGARLVPTGANGDKRIALVIGNSKYSGFAPLPNPTNDARDMSRALKQLGFEVIEVLDADQKRMNRAIVDFGSRLTGDSVALFYYAGHALQVKGKNYLLPIDAVINTENAVRAESVDVAAVLDQFAASPLNIVILDSCRNNPFEHKWRSAGGGLAQMDAPKGTLIAYATAPGKTAADGDGRNGLYTQELLKAMTEPGVPVEQMFKRVRANVTRLSGDGQTPWESSSLTGDFYFKPGTPIASLSPTLPVPAGPKAPTAGDLDFGDLAKEEKVRSDWAAWQAKMQANYDRTAAVKGSADLKAKAWERFLAAYPQDNPYSDEDERLRTAAQQAKQEAERQPVQVAMATPPQSLGRAGQTFKDCADCPEMVVIPAGSFDMGSNDGESVEKPVHRVSVPAFALGKTEVTQGQWRAVMGSNPSYYSNCGDDCPVEQVSWDDAQEYIRKLSAKTGQRYRLPSEAEWEYAARAGTTTSYWWGNQASHEYMNYGKDECCGGLASGRDRWVNTAPVGQFPANAFGLYDMNGNVWEWTEDCYQDSYRGAPTDGSARTGGGCEKRVLRGGSWYVFPQFARSAHRDRLAPSGRSSILGFRPARILTP